VAGFRRIVGAEAGLNLIKSLVKLAALGLVTVLVLRRAWPRFGDLADAAPLRVLEVLRGASLELALTVGLAFLAMGLLDFLVQRIRYERSLRMTRYEVLQEFKEQEGDPQIKARIRQIARQRARQRMLSHVARADVVVTNPTHLAVALKYDPLASAAPVVLAMGERKLAERIKLLALRAGVPLVENRPLARALLQTAKVGAPIPPALYVAVAEILAYVYRRRGRMPAAVARAADRSAR
jgi:flagellar biosynthetic protein FlhB